MRAASEGVFEEVRNDQEFKRRKKKPAAVNRSDRSRAHAYLDRMQEGSGSISVQFSSLSFRLMEEELT